MSKLAINGGEPVFKEKINYAHQYIDDNDLEAVSKVLKSDFLTCGPEVIKTEEKLCSLTGAKHAVLVSSGTAALHIACLASGIKAGDEVITTPITFAASANCILYCGAKPVFADINPDTYNISPQSIEKCITKNTKAVITVDFTGQAVELDKIKKICDAHGIVLIEDAAHSLGTKYKGENVGNIADMTEFSFHPVKTCTAGEGGAILTNNDELYEKLILFRSHGITRDRNLLLDKSEGPWYYEQLDLGYNYRMTDIQAALLSSQLDKLQKFSERRKTLVNRYDDAFSNIPEIIVQKEIKESDTVRHLYIIQLDLNKLHCSRKEIFEALIAEGVGVNVHYIPVYYLPYYQNAGYKKGHCPNAERLYERIITIPLYYSMTNEEQDNVIYAIKKVINYYKR